MIFVRRNQYHYHHNQYSHHRRQSNLSLLLKNIFGVSNFNRLFLNISLLLYSTTNTSSFVYGFTIVQPLSSKSTLLSSSVVGTNTKYIFKIHPTTRTMASTTTTTTKGTTTITTSTSTSSSNIKSIPNVIVIGSANYDITCYTNRIPQMGETVIGQSIYMSCGGKGSNQAKAIACLLNTNQKNNHNHNKNSVYMICRVGNDIFGHEIIKMFQQYNILYNTKNTILIMNDSNDNNNDNNTTHTTTTTTTTGVASIVVNLQNDCNNQIIVTPGTNHLLQYNNHVHSTLQQLLSLPLPSSSLPSSSSVHTSDSYQQQQQRRPILLLQFEISYETIFATLQEQYNNYESNTIMKPFIIVNPAPVPNDINIIQQLEQQYYTMIDILIPNETELRQLCYINNDTTSNDNTNEVELAISLLQKGIRYAVIVTLGERGALVVERNQRNTQDTASTTTTLSETDLTITYVQAPLDIFEITKNKSIQDTVGAGDAFCGALAAYLSITPIAVSITPIISSTTTTNTSTKLSQLASMACGYATMSIYQRGTNYPKENDIPLCLQINSLILPSSSLQTEQQPPPLSLPLSSINDPTSEMKSVLTFVTGNIKKLEEVRQILGTSKSSSSDSDGTSATTTSNDDFPYTIMNQKIDLPELQGNDVYEIAKEKCRIAASMINGPCFIEDTSLCFNALHGLPGPYIKWFLEKCGHIGLNQMLSGFDDKTAYAQTIIAYTDNNITEDNDNNHHETMIHVFDGRTDGRIVLPRGNLDFGWDPIFEPKEGNGLTYAEMDKYDKNQISHRGRSFQKFREFLIERSKTKQSTLK